MGNKQSSQEQVDKHAYKKTTQAVSVQPYISGKGPSTKQSKIEKYFKRNRYDEISENGQRVDYIRNNRDKQNSEQNLYEEIKQIEQQYFSEDTLKQTRLYFELLTQDNKMGKKKLLEYFGLEQFSDYELGNRFFQCCKSTLSRSKAGPYLDYSKFIKSISMLSSKNTDGRLNFLYTIFDLDLSGKIEIREFQIVLRLFLEALCLQNFADQEYQNLQNIIINAHERQIDYALDRIVNDIYQQYQTESNVLAFEEWKQWFIIQESMTELLNYDIEQSQYDEFDDL